MRNLIFWAAGLVLSVYLAVMYTTPAFLIAIPALLLLLLLEAGSVCYMRSRLSVTVRPPEKLVFRGEAIPVVLQLNNKGVLPVNRLYLRVRFGNTNAKEQQEKWVCAYVRERSPGCVTVNLESISCGMLQFEIGKVRIGGYLHLLSVSKNVNVLANIAIFPKLFPMEAQIQEKTRNYIGESDHFSAVQSGDDPSEVFDVREFQPGDRLQRVHWKLTARTQEYMVKDFSQPTGYPVIVFLNFSEDTATAGSISQVIEAGLSISLALAQANCRHYIVWCREDLTVLHAAIESAEDVYDHMGDLLYVKPHAVIPDPEDFAGHASGFENFCSFICVSTNGTIVINGETYEEQGLSRHLLSGKNIIL